MTSNPSCLVCGRPREEHDGPNKHMCPPAELRPSKELSTAIRAALEERPVWNNAYAATKFGSLLSYALGEIERLAACLAAANANHERFEREWYLRGDEIERLRQRVAELERSEDQLIGERDRAEDALQETHIALGGDGEWVGRSPPQSAPESGDLVLDVPELARERFTELERLRAPSPPAVWQPIETAPKYRDVLAWRSDAGAFVAQFRGMDGLIDENDESFDADFEAWFANDTGWMEGAETPTHWQPLPDGPDLAKESAPPVATRSELELAAIHYVNVAQDRNRSRYVSENGRHPNSGGPWAELVNAVDAASTSETKSGDAPAAELAAGIEWLKQEICDGEEYLQRYPNSVDELAQQEHRQRLLDAITGSAQPPIDARVHPDTHLIDSLGMRSTLNDMAARADSTKPGSDV